MKKIVVFVLAICLLALAILAVLSVTYPEMQEGFRAFFEETGRRIGNFFELFTEPFRKAFLRE